MIVAHCHLCGYEVDTHSDFLNGYEPKPGDLSICLDCGELAAFTPEMTLRALHPHECAKLPENALTCQFAIRYRGRIKR